MKPFILLFCVTASTLAQGRERRALFDAPVSVAPSRTDELARGAQDRVVAALESAQHFGSRDHAWLWITPSFGAINGATLRFDFR